MDKTVKQASMTFSETDETSAAEAAKGPPPGKPRQASISDALIRPLLERIAGLENVVSERLALADENRTFAEELRRKDREIALRDTEIEKLKRDLMYQKRLLEKEVGDRSRVLEEKKALMDREISERIARERDGFENRLAMERGIWSERLAREQEKHKETINEMQSKEGFFARLMRMLTWS